jgi:hypothetical protein
MGIDTLCGHFAAEVYQCRNAVGKFLKSRKAGENLVLSGFLLIKELK